VTVCSVPTDIHDQCALSDQLHLLSASCHPTSPGSWFNTGAAKTKILIKIKSLDAVALFRLEILLCISLHTHTASWDSIVSIEKWLRAGQPIRGKRFF